MDKKIFLIVTADKEKQSRLEQFIKSHVAHPVFYFATDGSLALSKVQNVRPHVVLTDFDLPKLTGRQLIDSLLSDRTRDPIAIVITDHLPESESFVDDVVTGRVQFLSDLENQDEVSRCLVRALNFAAHQHKADFNLRFLAEGDRLISEGEKPDYVYILKSGQLRASKVVDGKSTILGFIEPGEFVGEMAYINGEKRTADVEAVRNSELIEVPIGTFEQVLFSRPSWSKAMMQTLSKRLIRANAIK